MIPSVHEDLCEPLIRMGMTERASELYSLEATQLLKSSSIKNPIEQAFRAGLYYHMAAYHTEKDYLKLEYYEKASTCYDNCGDRESAKLCRERIVEIRNRRHRRECLIV
jgi:hypothetical protein